MKLKLYLFTLALLCQFIIFGQTIDQQNSPEETSFISTNYPDAGGQSFTAGVTGDLSQIDLKINSKSFTAVEGSFDLLVYSGNGYGGTLLNTTSLEVLLDYGVQNISFTLSSPIAITSGNFYTMRLVMNNNIDMDTRITMGNTYSDGGLYYQEGNASFYNLGDLWFITYVTTGPNAPTASAQSFCEGATVADLQATGTDLKWYTAETDGTALVTTTVLSSATYYVSQTVNETESERTSVSVNVSSAITVTATSTNVSCNGYNDGSITTTVSGGTAPYIYFWSNGETTASISNLQSGTYNLLAVIDDNGCELGDGFGNPYALSVTISQPAFLNAPTAEAQAFCGAATVADLLPESSSTIIWYNVATEGSALEATASLATGTYYVSETNANGCESERTTVNVSLNEMPHAPTANSVQIYTSEATIADLTVTGTGLLWYDAATNGTSLDLTVSLVDGTTYYVSQTTTCGESLKTAITVKQISEASQDFCGSATVENLTSSPSTDATVNWYPDATGGTALENSTALGTGTYYVEQETPTTVTTLASGFIFPHGVAIQADGKIVVADTYNDEVKRMDADGSNIEILGSDFVRPRGVAIQSDGKIVVVGSSGSNSIKRMNADGSSIEILGSGFVSLNAVAIQADGKIVVADTQSDQIKRMDANGFNIEILGSGFNSPYGVAIQTDGRILVANYHNNDNTVKRMNADGLNIEILGSGFSNPSGVAVQADGKIVVAELGNNSIKRMNADGTGIEILGNGFEAPAGLTIQANGDILVTDGEFIKRITEGLSNRVAVSVTINEIPDEPTVTTPITYSEGDTASELAVTTGGSGVLWYTTETGGTGSTTAPTPSTATVGSTSYWVTSTNENGCESERVEVVVSVEETLGINENEMLKNINIYPNPTKAYVTITLPKTQESKITVYDLNGRLLLNQSNTNGNFKIDLSAYQAGVYLLKIEVNQNEIIKRIIKN
ncbi:Ig-like domain-containing protein [Bizionia arctica]|uniref:T9SS type A sorting domain-containing protein n=1 Tax=Bizionia arctica TaxID=1495645 RepID=A0A917GXF8_9FLAO|nr:T9SS type A sorting domain-containing protein [Bizionia arctica]GGG60383.1 hypothetical protein GCM10010976_33970 [Bizionia arctica]